MGKNEDSSNGISAAQAAIQAARLIEPATPEQKKAIEIRGD
jgi:hypothetical protein